MTEEEEYQRLETAATIAELLKRNPELKEGIDITLDLFFRPGDAADPDGAIKRLAMFGYPAEVEEDGSLSVTSPQTRFTLDSIWEHEERTTKLAAQHGFTPDGWGFFGD